MAQEKNPNPDVSSLGEPKLRPSEQRRKEKRDAERKKYVELPTLKLPPVEEPISAPAPIPGIPMPMLTNPDDIVIPDEMPEQYEVTGWESLQLTRALRKLVERKLESLNLYEPLTHVEPFHASQAPERTLRGSNRSGKTLAAAVEVARAVTNRDPHKKYPMEDGRAYLVAYDGKQVAEVLYRKLFRAGAFRIIKDQKTRLWRAYRPWDAEDEARFRETKPAPPLIPPRYVKSAAWENKTQQIPTIIRLTTGWELSFFSSNASPPRGVDLDLLWFDEEIVGEWYVEGSARLLDRRGKFLWSATPQNGSEQLYDLSLQAADQEDQDEPRVIEFFMDLDANPHISQKDKQIFASKLTSDEDRRIRIGGQFAVVSFKVYPEFSMITHGCDPFLIPPDWTLYMVTDPGRQVCGVLFAAIPPPSHELSDRIFIYDELYLKNCSAQTYGEAVKRKTDGRRFFAFIIDHHGGRVSEVGSGTTVEFQYSEALKDNDVSSQATGHGYIWGSDDIPGGIEKVRSLLLIRQEGAPRLQVFRGPCPNLEWEFLRYKWRRRNGQLIDKPDDRNDHLMDTLRYLAAYEPVWHAPPKVGIAKDGAYSAYREKLKRSKDGEFTSINLGPGAGVFTTTFR